MLKLNGKVVEFGRFPNKELNLPIQEVLPKNKIEFTFRDNESIWKLCLLKYHIDELGGKASLYMTYFPYERMDRANGVYSVSVQVMKNVLLMLNFDGVTVREPHSNVCLGMGFEPDWWCKLRLERAAEDCWASSIFYPDKGAMDRYKGATDKFPISWGKKSRDFKTSKITGLELRGDVKRSVLIVDDLCSRGGTFVESVKLLREQGAKRIYLLVAHCEDNVFTGELFDYVDRLYCSDSILTGTHPRITILN